MRKKTLLILLLVAAVLVGAGVLIRPRPGADAPAPPPAGNDETAAPLVRAAVVERATLEEVVPATGTVRAESSVMVVPETAGVLESFLVDGRPVAVGVRLEKGQLLGRVASRHLEAAVREAESRLRASRTARLEVQVHLEDARRDYERMEALYREGALARRERDRAETAVESAAARLEHLDDQVRLAETALESARLRYDDSRVVSPAAGLVSEKFVDEGSYVSPQTPLLRVVGLDRVEVVAALAEQYLPRLEPGRTVVRIHFDALPDRVFTGTLTRVEPEVDRLSRTVEAIVVLDNPAHLVRPGMFARMEIIVARRERVPVVPDHALVGDGDRVLVISDGRVTGRPVRLGLKVDYRHEVLAGLVPGERVVIRGHHLLEEGMAVTVAAEEAKE